MFPGQDLKWGLSFLINPQQGPAGRSGGSLSWAGLANTYFWIDPSKRVAGVILTQILPFVDAQVIEALRPVRERRVQGGVVRLIIPPLPRPPSQAGAVRISVG